PISLFFKSATAFFSKEPSAFLVKSHQLFLAYSFPQLQSKNWIHCLKGVCRFPLRNPWLWSLPGSLVQDCCFHLFLFPIELVVVSASVSKVDCRGLPPTLTSHVKKEREPDC
ncbi:MAG: hypothetical protein QF849_19560, partial [Pseudomonadales bacterium]|nr:hypothetical protein [Pseudomonadales bacterium]